MFYVYNKEPEGPRFTFHTAFEDPHTPSDAPDRESIEVRTIACFDDHLSKPIFFDMIHSNNARRVRLWVELKGLHFLFDTRIITYPDLQSEEFKRINPLKKVPAFITSEGHTIFESYVIMSYLEDKYGQYGPSFMLDTPEERAFVELLVRMHDIYIASPNSTQPGFSHTQGCMYLSPYVTEFCSAERVMKLDTRAKKLAEIWKQLTWLESQVKGPYLAGDRITHADMTWFPTAIFMEFMLPRVYEWPEIFHETDNFPKLTTWHAKCMKNPIFARIRGEIWDFWVGKEEAGQFKSIIEVVRADTEFKWKYP